MSHTYIYIIYGKKIFIFLYSWNGIFNNNLLLANIHGFLAAECKYKMYKEENIYVENKTDLNIVLGTRLLCTIYQI